MSASFPSRTGIVARILILFLLAIAYVDPTLDRGPSPADMTLFIDRSASMGDAPTPADIENLSLAVDDLPAGSVVRQVHFASGQPVVMSGRPNAQTMDEGAHVDRRDSDLLGSMRGIVEPETALPQLRVLVSDGRVSELPGPEFGGWWPIQPVAKNGEAGLGRLVFAPSDEGFWTGRVMVFGPPRTKLRVEIRVDGRSSATHTATIDKNGAGWLDLLVDPLPPGRHVVEASLGDGSQGEPLNDTTGQTLNVTGPGRVLYLSDETDRPGQRFLGSMGWSVDTSLPEALPDRREDLTPYDLVFLDDVSADRLSAPALAALDAAVQQNGLGLLVLGGSRSYSAGGYLGSELEPLLPVLSEDAARDRPTRLVFLVDSSGSMSESVPGGTRFTYAMQAVELGLEALRKGDETALVFFDRTATVHSGLAPAPDSFLDDHGEIDRTPSGGTDLVGGLRAALDLFPDESNADHTLVLISDGNDGSEASPDFGELAELRAESRAVLLPILISPDASATSATIDSLDTLGSGAVSLVSRVEELPRLTRDRIDSRKMPIRMGPHTPVVLAPLPGATGADRWPPVQAYPVTRARDEATVYMSSENGHPLVASWRRGIGRVMAVTPGLGMWTEAWLAEPALVQDLAGLIVWTAGRARTDELSLSLIEDKGDLRIKAEVVDEAGEWRTDEAPKAVVIAPSGDSVPLDLSQTAPGLFEGRIEALQQGVYEATVTTEDAQARRAIWVANAEAQQAGDPRLGAMPGLRVIRPGDPLLPPDWPRVSWQLQPLVLALAIGVFLALLTFELRPNTITEAARLAHRARSAISQGKGRIRKESRGRTRGDHRASKQRPGR